MHAFTVVAFLALINEGEMVVESSFGYHRNLLASPEIRVSKWISDADRDYLDESENYEWNEKIDTDSIQTSGFGSKKEYIVSQHVAAIAVECQASYPVQWIFHNAQYVTDDLIGIQMKTFRRSTSVTDSKDDVYYATLQITTESNRATGNYSCRSTESSQLSADVFIFWEGISTTSIVLAGRLVEVGVMPKSTTVEIPCYVSSASASVEILKEGAVGDFKPLPSTISSKFDPKLGFQLSFHNISDAVGRYRCQTEGDESADDVMETLVRLDLKEACQGSSCFQRKVSSGTTFYFDEKTEELVCCGRSRLKSTRLHTLFCQNPSVCCMFEPVMYSTTAGINGRKSGNGSCVTERIYPRDFGLARCIGDGIDVLTYVYTEFWTPDQEYLRAVFDWKQLNPQNMIHLMIHAPSPLYNNQRVVATCQTLHSYFSDGIKWAIKWRNGSLTYFDSKLSTENDARLHGIRSTYLQLSLQMDELICYAPQWNSTRWVEKNLKLDIKPSEKPTIVGDTVEDLTFALNDTEKILECVSNAKPPAKIKWTKNEQEVPRKMVIWNENGTSVLLFKTVTYNSHGIYKCYAKNEVGQVEKTFQVFVEDTRHSSWSTAFAVVIPILVIVFMSIFIFLMWKMQLQKKVVDHLTRVVFRDSGSS